MTTINLPTRLAPIALAALLFAPAAGFAQSTPPSSTPPAVPGATAPGAQGTMPTAPKQTAAERVEQRIQQLHASLHIAPAQQQQWKQFADVMRANARDMDAALEQRQHGFETMNAVQNLRSYEELAKKHAQHLQKLAVAFNGLYDKLSGEQKKAADNEFRARAEARAEEREQRMQSGSSTQPQEAQPHTAPSGH